jgi:hypothetical protein
MPVTWKFDVSDDKHKCFLLTYILDGKLPCQKYWNFVGNPVYFKVFMYLTWKIFMSYNMKLSFYMTWNFYILGADKIFMSDNIKVSCCITWNFYFNSYILESSLLLNTKFLQCTVKLQTPFLLYQCCLPLFLSALST